MYVSTFEELNQLRIAKDAYEDAVIWDHDKNKEAREKHLALVQSKYPDLTFSWTSAYQGDGTLPLLITSSSYNLDSVNHEIGHALHFLHVKPKRLGFHNFAFDLATEFVFDRNVNAVKTTKPVENELAAIAIQMRLNEICGIPAKMNRAVIYGLIDMIVNDFRLEGCQNIPVTRYHTRRKLYSYLKGKVRFINKKIEKLNKTVPQPTPADLDDSVYREQLLKLCAQRNAIEAQSTKIYSQQSRQHEMDRYNWCIKKFEQLLNVYTLEFVSSLLSQLPKALSELRN
jgi:hypothetical protein